MIESETCIAKVNADPRELVERGYSVPVECLDSGDVYAVIDDYGDHYNIVCLFSSYEEAEDYVAYYFADDEEVATDEDTESVVRIDRVGLSVIDYYARQGYSIPDECFFAGEAFVVNEFHKDGYTSILCFFPTKEEAEAFVNGYLGEDEEVDAYPDEPITDENGEIDIYKTLKDVLEKKGFFTC